MYWYSDDRSIQFNFNRQKSGRNSAFYGHWSSPVFLTNILKYKLDSHLHIWIFVCKVLLYFALRQSGNGNMSLITYRVDFLELTS